MCDEPKVAATAPNPVGLHPEQGSVTFEVSDAIIEERLDSWSPPVQFRFVYSPDRNEYDMEFRTLWRDTTEEVDPPVGSDAFGI